MQGADAALAVKAAWWAAKRLAWCRALGDGSVDRGHFKVVMNEFRVSRALDPGWQMESAGAGGGVGWYFSVPARIQWDQQTHGSRTGGPT